MLEMNMMNPMVSFANPNVKDSRWLTLEVCREFQRNKCTRTENECKFAHPPPHVEVQNGRVVACYDSLKGKCNRRDPPCKYLHPPQHLKDQLLQNGRNNLILKNLLASQQQALLAASYPANPGAPGGSVPSSAATPMLHQATGTVLPAAAVSYQQIPSPQMATVLGPYMNMNMNMNMTSMHGVCHHPLLAANGVQDSAAAIMQANAAASGLPSPISTSGASTPVSSANPSKVLRSDRVEVCRAFLRGLCKRGQCRHAHPSPSVLIDADGMVNVCPDFANTAYCPRKDCSFYHGAAGSMAEQTENDGNSAGANGSSPNPFHGHALFPFSQPSYSFAVSPDSQNSLGIQWLSAQGALDSAYLSALVSSQQSYEDASKSMFAAGNMIPVAKRPALADAKTGIPVYQPLPHGLTYNHQFAAVPFQHPYVPVSFAGHPAGVPRF